ncbi:hypothetical protein E0K83_01565 [Gramella sp. BOM4]|nr:hypothetical protein [Christiangramia bathymodioli]
MKTSFLLVFTSLVILGISSVPAQNPREVFQTMIPPLPEHILPEEPKGRILGPGLFNHSLPIREAYHSGSNTYAGHSAKGELYIRKEREDDLTIISEPKAGWRWDIADALWSPTGKYLLVKQIRDTGVPRIELTKTDTILHWPYTRAGESLPEIQYYIVTPETGRITAVDHNRQMPYVHPLSWNDTTEEVRIVQADRLMKNLELLRVDSRTGKSQIWFKDHSEEFLIGLDLLQGYTGRLREANFFYFLNDMDQFIYKSERSGYYQLYLYNKNGELLRPLTSYENNGLVDHLKQVDTGTGWVYFTSHDDPQHPYSEQLYRSSLTENYVQKIAHGPYFMDIFFSENKDSIWVWRHNLEKFSRLEIYSPDGEKLNTTWEVDMSILDRLGFAPEFEQLTASDGETLIEAMILKPKNFDQEKNIL